MGLHDGREEIVKRQMVLFLIVDTSGSMMGQKITIVNESVRISIPDLQDAGGSDIDVKVACLKFSTGCEWMYPTPIAADSFQWQELQADGVTDLGMAFEELNDKLSRNKFLTAPSGSVAPVLFLMSDGEPTDDYRSGLNKLKNNNWYKNAVKVALAIGSDANKDVLEEFTGKKELVISALNAVQLRKWIRKVTITSTMIGTKSYVDDGQPKTKQDALADEIKEIQQSDPDLSQTPTSADYW